MKRHAPATQRNRDPIAAVLRDELPGAGLVLEVASGTGEHAVHFAGLFPALTWQPSDPDEEALGSIRAWRAEAALPNLREPLLLDAAAQTWPVERADALLCINMVHISPWEATLGLLDGAARLLPAQGPLILYGPWRRAGVDTAASNEAFDRSLKERDPQWGLRHVEAFEAEAADRRFGVERLVEMPANNLMLVLRKTK